MKEENYIEKIINSYLEGKITKKEAKERITLLYIIIKHRILSNLMRR